MRSSLRCTAAGIVLGASQTHLSGEELEIATFLSRLHVTFLEEQKSLVDSQQPVACIQMPLLDITKSH
jgi:hypothetical protein